MISVIIPTFNRVDLALELIRALLGQTLDNDEYELIIIDDGSCHENSRALKDFSSRYSNIRYIWQENQGPAIARNRGIKEAKGDIVCFIDDDCIPNNDWLEVVKRKFSKNHATVGLEGYTYTIRKKISPLTHQVSNTKGGIFYPTCNIAYRAEFLIQERGFDTHFPYAHNEDVDLAWRMLKYGPIDFCREMVVCHPPRKDNFIRKIKRLKFLESEYYLYHKHIVKYKETRAANPWINIYWRVFFRFPILAIFHWLKYWRRPQYLIQSLTLSAFKWIYLLYLIPYFYRLNYCYKESSNTNLLM